MDIRSDLEKRIFPDSPVIVSYDHWVTDFKSHDQSRYFTLFMAMERRNYESRDLILDGESGAYMKLNFALWRASGSNNESTIRHKCNYNFKNIGKDLHNLT